MCEPNARTMAPRFAGFGFAKSKQVNLDDSVLYCEGRAEAEEFKRFSDWILNATPEELRARIVRPIMPDANCEEGSSYDR